MDYMLVASASFAKTHFLKQDLRQGLLKAPIIKFDQNDQLHEKYLEMFFQIDSKELNTHVIPSVQGFKRFVVLGYGYALIPKNDIVEELKKKQLILLSEKSWKVPLYWHSWTVETPLYRKFNREIVEYLVRKLI
jgi:LysR family transcriptional regulator (chromosome initiation inhibitor)